MWIAFTEMAGANKSICKSRADIVTSAMCNHQQRFGLDVQFSALALNFNNIFSNGHLYRAGQTMNSLPSQIPARCKQAYDRTRISKVH